MIHLLNAAVMPNEGQYTLRQISLSEFRTRLREAAEAANFQSYIGYPETARLIEEIVDVPIEVSRAQATLDVGDVMLIVKLRLRVAVPADKLTLSPSVDDLEFYFCEWHPLLA